MHRAVLMGSQCGPLPDGMSVAGPWPVPLSLVIARGGGTARDVPVAARLLPTV